MFRAKSYIYLLLALLVVTSGCIEAESKSSSQEVENKMFPDGCPPAEVIDIVNLRGQSKDIILAMTTLQGQVNSDGKSSLFYLFDSNPANTEDEFWLEKIKSKNYIKDYEKITIDQCLEKYKNNYQKVYVYDPNLKASINIANMLASIKNGIVIAPQHVKKFAQNKEVKNLSGMWKTNVQAYEWAFENLWDKMNHDLLASYHPDFNAHHMRDYFIAHNVFLYWITGKDHADGIISDHEKELEFAKRLWASSPVNIPIIGWVGAPPDEGITEYRGVGLAGQYGKLTVGADWGTNVSLLSGISVPMKELAEKYKKVRAKDKAPDIQDDKVYLSFVVAESGDAPIYWEHRQKEYWDDKYFGEVPIGWTFGPSVIELLPPVAEWHLEKITPKDELVIALSGAAYVHPYRGLFSKVNEPEKAWKDYLDLTEYYMNLFDIEQMCLYTDAWIDPFDREQKDPITRKIVNNIENLNTLIMGMGRDEGIDETNMHYFIDDVHVGHIVTRWDTQNIGPSEENNRWLADEIKKHTPKKRPAFIFVHPLSWSYGPNEMKKVLDLLGNEYKAVTPGVLSEMYRKNIGRK